MQRISGLGVFELKNEKDREKLKSTFIKTFKERPQRTLAALNCDAFSFSALYTLLPQIVASGAFDKLSPKCRTAAVLCAIADPEVELPAGVQKQLPEGEPCHTALKWALSSGYKDDGLCGGFDRALDIAACCLTRIYRDTSVLPVVAELIFRRNRKGRYIGDLVWALFSAKDPKSLSIIARYLLSPNNADAELAEKLLKDVDAGEFKSAPRNRKFAVCSSWLRENGPYLSFTDETFQQSCEPTLFTVDLEAKYLCKRAGGGPKAVQAFSQSHSDKAEAFRRLNREQQKALARFSHWLYGLDRRRWNRFMSYPVERQLKITQRRGGRDD